MAKLSGLRSNEYFDRVHPECKEWRDNKNLPDYCY